MKIDKFLVLMILSILFLSFFTYWQFKRLSKAIPKIEIPKIEIPKPESFFQQKTETKEFVSPDGKLKFKYSSDWMEMPKESGEKTINPEAKALFFATKFKMEKAAFASLGVQELSGKRDIGEIIKEMEKETKEKGGEMQILNSEIKAKEAYLKTRYKKEGEQNFISKEKIILGEEKVYLISIFSFERFWPGFEGESEEILNSVEII